MLWLSQYALRRGGGAGVHLLTCSICLFFLAEWVDGGLSPATVPHGNKQRQFFTLLRAARYERGNGTATSAAGQRTDHPCQTEFSSISVATTAGRTSRFQKQLTTRGGFPQGGAGGWRKTGISGGTSLLQAIWGLVETTLISFFLQLNSRICLRSPAPSHLLAFTPDKCS